MIIVSVHISYEWVFMDFILHYMFAIASGVLVGLSVGVSKSAKAAPVRSPNILVAPSGR
jgi:hypothetical protein